MTEDYRSLFVGLEAPVPILNGDSRAYINLDNAASTPSLRAVKKAIDDFLPYYSSVHRVTGYKSQLSTYAYEEARRLVMGFVGASPSDHVCIFGKNTTEAMNKLARRFPFTPQRNIVLVSLMEHHSNDLPNRKHFREVVHVPAEATPNSLGGIDLSRLESELKARSDRVNYVAITGVSNVTGIVNPIHKIAQLAHQYGALVVVDAAQMAAHVPIRMSGNTDASMNLDVLAFSGHKVYAPGSPGVVVARRSLFSDVEPAEVGGGMVKEVSVDRYTVADHFPDREEAGTPNVSGAIGLAAALYTLKKIGMENVWVEEDRVLQ